MEWAALPAAVRLQGGCDYVCMARISLCGGRTFGWSFKTCLSICGCSIPEFKEKFSDWWQECMVEGWEGHKFMRKLKETHLDVALIANEVVDEKRRSGEEGVVFKIDFEKTYDHVDWGF
ncbi:hypothetical protein CK203_114738 [Vitis vinifera]|uniref:Reverse transcriptase domain-containing protein n=1 Tax=Vitis vinifera TaxID=29760 RepID=A0A438CY52_VITVI|nr:hypothetical protein CK203_114738 [Vitis vinifera]